MKILRHLSTNDIVFIDIETVRCENTLKKGSALESAWEYKVRYESEGKSKETSPGILFKEKAALYAEFGKIVCITVGRIHKGKEGGDAPIFKNYSHEDEKVLLQSFMDDLNKVCYVNKNTFLLGHAIKGFDMPFIFRRCLINGVEPNHLFDIGDIKPWDLTAKDTMELWKSGAFYSASLIAISTAFGLPSPKNDINGSEVSDVYWADTKLGLERVVKYCMKDVLTLINVFRKCRFEEPFIIKEIYEIGEPKKVVRKPRVKKAPVTKNTKIKETV